MTLPALLAREKVLRPACETPATAPSQELFRNGTTLRALTFGCRVNQYETELVRESLLRQGFRDALPHEPPDVCLVNTCTVTAEADAKARQALRRLARRYPQTRIVVMGCYATREPERLQALPGVAQVISHRHSLDTSLRLAGLGPAAEGIRRFAEHQRAWVKVQDGCLLRCSFCVIPQVRPRFVSRPAQAVLSEVRDLVAAGYREIVLTGIHLGHYGVEWCRTRPREAWVRLAQLLEQVVRLEGDFRVRLSSLEAQEVSRDLIAVMADFAPRVCPHLHLCLQSGSDRVLRLMRRRGDVRRYLDRCRLAADRLDHPAFSTDVIVGFPGETDADFAATCRVVEEVGFAKLHLFPFSPREGTPAAELPSRVPARVVAERMRELSLLGEQVRQRYLRSLVARELEVLVEGVDAATGQSRGTTCRGVPAEFAGPATLRRQLVRVLAQQATPEGLVCRAL